jgi:hypothetical protein
MGMRRFTRLANAFSKKVDNHKGAFALLLPVLAGFADTRDPLFCSRKDRMRLHIPACPHPNAVSARARRIQRRIRGSSLRGTYSRVNRSRPAAASQYW